jgi:hypothetical protein
MSEEAKRIVAEEVWETIFTEDDAVISVEGCCGDQPMGVRGVAPFTAARSDIAICAPEALSFMLDNEFAYCDGRRRCLDCDVEEPGTIRAHSQNCRWLAIMAKAGLR